MSEVRREGSREGVRRSVGVELPNQVDLAPVTTMTKHDERAGDPQPYRTGQKSGGCAFVLVVHHFYGGAQSWLG